MSTVKSLPEEVLEMKRKAFPTFLTGWELRNHPMRDKWMKEECYCPISLALRHVLGLRNEKDVRKATEQEFMHASLTAAIIGWKQTKLIYEFDPDLSIELLKQSTDDLKITSDLIKLPAWCIYIDLPGGDISGAFVSFDWTPSGKRLYVIPVWEHGDMYYTQVPRFMPIPKTPKTIDDLMNEMYNKALFQIGQSGKQDLERKVNQDKRLMKYVVNALSYLNAVNGDVVLKKETSSKEEKKGQEPVHVKEYKVGERVGMRLKEFHKARTMYMGNEQKEHHSAPVMHIRRAHWHTYLKGKGRKEKELKWQLPIVVNGNGKEIDVVSLVKVKDEGGSEK